MRPYVFLDRDGVVNQERGKHTFKAEDFVWVDGFWDGLISLQKAGFRFGIITNQSGIAQGFYGHAEVEYLNQIIHKEANRNGLEIDFIYYCPHHPNFSRCLCRKPSRLLFERAVHQFQVDVANSWMIGDKERDIIPARELGFKTLQVVANSNFAANITPLLAHG
ncbi:MAG: D-glycero-alpha-D-manno-heptose-1,7-bisphosphate 7-phosphatase [Luteibaculum sp.]